LLLGNQSARRREAGGSTPANINPLTLKINPRDKVALTMRINLLATMGLMKIANALSQERLPI